jgi:DNA-binding Lrp family transcriptional regulator
MREQIEEYLRTVAHSTAKTIAERIGLPQLDVAHELNRMARDGVVEREKRKGSEYVYWLARVDVTSAQVPASAAQSQQIVNAAVAMPPVREEVTSADEPRDELKHLSERFQELLAVLGLPPTITQAIAAAREMKAIALRTAADRDILKEENERLRDSNGALDVAVTRLRENNAALERRIDELTLGKPGESGPVFVTIGRHAKPMRHTSIEKAQRRAGSLIRSEKESEVLVCEPIGRMVRGSEWVGR